jgi:hypothetical protein
MTLTIKRHNKVNETYLHQGSWDYPDANVQFDW